MSLFGRKDPVVAECKARYGRMTYLRNDVWHGRAFREYGEWSEAEVELWRAYVFPGDVVLDVGAHIGAHALALASLVGPRGRVHAFEPQRVVRDVLSANVVANRAWNVTTWPVGLGRYDGDMRHERQDYEWSGNYGGVELTAAARGEPVPVRRLDRLGVPGRFSFAKIDVEGMELDALEGGARLIAECRPVIYAEADRGDRRGPLFAWLRAAGYRLWWHAPPLYNPANWRRNRRNVFGDVVSLNVLAIPPGGSPPLGRFLSEVSA